MSTSSRRSVPLACPQSRVSLRDRRSDLRTLFISDHAEDVRRHGRLSAPLLHEPFRPVELMARMRELLDT